MSTVHTAAGPAWRKATASGNGGCVELASLSSGRVAVRDSKLGEDSPVLVFTSQEWHAFLDGVSRQEFSDLGTDR